MILKNLIYIYQLENYNKKRFLFFVYRNLNWFKLSKRGKLNFTIRANLLFLITSGIVFLVAGLVFWLSNLIITIVFLLFLFIILPFIVICSDIIISPLVLFQKNRIIKQAKKIVLQNKERGLITIGITGSFGKTSMRNVLISVLSEKYKIFTFTGNINTDIGVAQYIVNKKDEIANSEILISEMGAYKIGDIKKLCQFIFPDYSVTTAIGESHLDRFGSFENIVSAKFELANLTKLKIFLNICDENVKKYADNKINTKTEIVKVCGKKEIQNFKILDNFKGITFNYNDEEFQTKLIASYVVDFAIIAFKIADELSLSMQEMKDGLKKLDFIPHRLEIIQNKELNRIIINDGYNGNYAGFLEGLNVLSRAKGRKIVLTPGIVELGKEKSKEIHFKLAEKYSKFVDLVLLVKNPDTDFIVEKFKEIGYNKFKVYKITKEAHNDLVNILKNGDTIIFQNDITDNYL